MHFGTVCTSFTWINADTHGRRLWLPVGNEHLDYVALGSRLVERTVLLAFLAWHMGAVFSIENPLGSLMAEQPIFQSMIQYFQVLLGVAIFPSAPSLPIDSSTLRGIWRGHVPLGCYGAPSRKMVWMYSCSEKLLEHLMNEVSVTNHATTTQDKETGNGPVTYRPLGQAWHTFLCVCGKLAGFALAMLP